MCQYFFEYFEYFFTNQPSRQSLYANRYTLKAVFSLNFRFFSVIVWA
jgi:hypothetical protein